MGEIMNQNSYNITSANNDGSISIRGESENSGGIDGVVGMKDSSNNSSSTITSFPSPKSKAITVEEDDDPCSEGTATSDGEDLTDSMTQQPSANIDRCNSTAPSSTAPLIDYAATETSSDERTENSNEITTEAENQLNTVPSDEIKDSGTSKEELNNGDSLSIPTTPTVKPLNVELQDPNLPSPERLSSPKRYMSGKVLEDNGKLNEKLKKRWAKRNQYRKDGQNVTPPRNSNVDSRNDDSSRLKSKSDGSAGIILDNLSTTPEICPDVVSFGVEDDDNDDFVVENLRSKNTPTYRKWNSEIGPNTSSTASPRRIGILQADGIVYDDALLLRLARQTQCQRNCGKGDNVDPITGEEFPEFQTNEVKIHVYDLLTQDALVEVPYFNCNFPVGRCFKAVNDSCNYFGTGAYHVGVEVNGVEYAYGGNNIPGMSGIFTCIPKESPGYDYRDTIDLGKVHTTTRIWIKIPKETYMNEQISAALAELTDDEEDVANDQQSGTTKTSQHQYSFREIETFAEGNAIVHDMVTDYMGLDYDLLRKNCCTFARDACLRLGVKEEEIPNWFHNAAAAGAQAEDTMNHVDNTMKGVFNCSENVPSLETEECRGGFEVIAEMGGHAGCNMPTSLKVVESTPERNRKTFLGIPVDQLEQDLMRDTSSWV